ncbi:MAG: polysaccharide biosynthesis protein [Pseudoalteromonas sp.]|nr:polysaccharide biosynthesis protein [Pseudoalteromonas sp.]|tara:strand:+ start:2800 stop:4320 length:1521 start_codon:yes stop_codon:yes gene_type:complete
MKRSPSLKLNILANYASQLYVTGIGIFILPIYIKYMGAEAYGLIGFFAMLQAWFAMLDFGLTPTISRETARYYGGSTPALNYLRLFRALSLIFIGIALLGGVSLWVFAEPIALKWLDFKELSQNEVVFAVEVMGVSVALRWLCGLYRGVITGFERIVLLSAFNVVIATLRFVIVFVTMGMFGFTPEIFFLHQLVVAVLELLGLYVISKKLIPNSNEASESLGWSIKPVKPILKFSLTIAFTSFVWVLITQSDKLILSGILPLDEYGFFSLAVMVASGVLVVSGPVSNAIMPRMARLYSEKKNSELISVYKKSTQLVCIFAGSVAFLMVIYAEKLIYVWTGDAEITEQVSPILKLYSFGNGLLLVTAFPYYLQYAIGNLRYHFLGNAASAFVLIPSIIVAAQHYGAFGAGVTWVAINLIYLFFWVGYVHHKLFPGLHFEWLFKDCLLVALPSLAFMYITSFVQVNFDNRVLDFIYLMLILSVSVVIAFLFSSYRSFVFSKMRGCQVS